jgi:hypothetical protein
MTIAKVSQAGAELCTVFPGARVSQAGTEVLSTRPRVQRRISSSGDTDAISQAGVEILYKSVPCGTRWAQTWTITRSDGGTCIRFTSLDRDLDWGKRHSYKACNSLDPTASEAVAEVDSRGQRWTCRARSGLTFRAINSWDLYAGRSTAPRSRPGWCRGPGRRPRRGG